MSLRTENLAVAYGPLQALSSCSVRFAPGQLVGLLGPNGAGKTSLLRALTGLVDASGAVYWHEQELQTLRRRERATTIAYLPQSPAAHWPITVRELVALGRLPHRRFGQSAGQDDEAAIERAMVWADIAKHASRPVDALSGGERMRAQLARVLAVEAPVLLVDEPVANLDPAHQLMVMELLGRYADAGRTVVAVMHDLTLAARFCTRVVVLEAGTIVGDGAPTAVLTEAMLERVYRVRAIVTTHRESALIVPWQRLG